MNRQSTRSSLPGRILRFLKWTLVLAVLAGLMVLAFMPRPVQVDLAAVSRGPMILSVDDDGETRVRERYTITAPLAGSLQRIHMEAGAEIKQGDTLAILSPLLPQLLDARARTQAEAAARSAEAQLEHAHSLLASQSTVVEFAEKEYRRLKMLRETGSIPESEYEDAESAWITARHALAAAQSSVGVAEFELQQARAALLHLEAEAQTPAGTAFIIRAPLDGRVLRVPDKSGRVVAAGEVLMEVADPADLEMVIDVLSQDAVHLKSGQKILVEHWGGGEPLHGRVRSVEPSGFTKVSALGVDEQRVNVIADFEAPPPHGKRLGDGFRVEARIIIWEGRDVLRLPVGALFRQGGQWAVYQADGDRARLTRVEVGRNNGEQAEVLSGLEEGDRVLLHPGDLVEDGTLIRPRP